MRNPRIHTEQALRTREELVLTGNAAHHAGRVLRMEAGQWLTLFNGDGLDYQAQILEAGRKSLRVHVSESSDPATESPLSITLGQVMSWGPHGLRHPESHGTGVTHIQPLTSERCEVKLSGDRERKRIANWQQVAISAAEQCGRARIPQVASPLKLGDWLNSCTQDLRLVLHDRGSPLGNNATLPASIALLVGPEGGLAEQEIDSAHNAGFLPLALGPASCAPKPRPLPPSASASGSGATSNNLRRLTLHDGPACQPGTLEVPQHPRHCRIDWLDHQLDGHQADLLSAGFRGYPPLPRLAGHHPSKAEKMATIAVDATIAKIGTVQEIFEYIDPRVLTQYVVDHTIPRTEGICGRDHARGTPHLLGKPAPAGP